MSTGARQWLGAVVVAPFVALVFLAHVPLSDAWRGGLEFVAGVGAVAAIATWVAAHRAALREYE